MKLSNSERNFKVNPDFFKFIHYKPRNKYNISISIDMKIEYQSLHRATPVKYIVKATGNNNSNLQFHCHSLANKL